MASSPIGIEDKERIIRGSAASRSRGVAILSVLAIIFLFTLLGYAILKLANRDTYLSDALIDIKSRELAAQAGFEMVLGRLQARPYNAAAILQTFVGDSGLSEADKRRWLILTADSIYASASDADAWFSIGGTASSKAAFKVRIVGIDDSALNTGTSGGGGIDILLEATGRDRKGNQSRVEAVYRAVGLDVPVTELIVSDPPKNALFLSGSGNNIDLGGTLNGGVFLGTGGTIQGKGITINGPFRSGGNILLNDSLIVNGKSYIKGTFYTQGAKAVFNDDLTITGGFAGFNCPVEVTGNATIYGSSAFDWNSNTRLKVTKQLWIKDYAPLNVINNSTGAIEVDGNAYFHSLSMSNNAKITVLGNMELTGAGNSTLEYVRVGGNFASRDSSAPRTLQLQKAFVVKGNFLHHGILRITAGPDSIDGWMRVDSGIASLAGGGGDTLNPVIGGSLFLARKPHYAFNGYAPWIGGDLVMNGSVDAGFGGGSTRKWTRRTLGGTWSYNNSASLASTAVKNFANAVQRTTDTTFPTLGYTPPLTLAQQGYTAWDTTVSLDSAANKPDTVMETAIDTSLVKTLTKACWEFLNRDYNACQNTVANSFSGAILDTLYTRFQAANKLYNGYMVLKFASSDPSINYATTGSLFNNKAIFLVDRDMGSAGAKWPGGSANSRQVIKVMSNGSFSEWGPRDSTIFYGFIIWNRNNSSDKIKLGVNSWIYGAMEFAGSPMNVQFNSGGTMNIDVTANNVLRDIQSEIPAVLRFARRTSGGTPTYVSTRKIVVARGATSIQFRRLSERR